MSYEINILCVGQTAPIDCRPAGFELKNEVEDEVLAAIEDFEDNPPGGAVRGHMARLFQHGGDSVHRGEGVGLRRHVGCLPPMRLGF